MTFIARAARTLPATLAAIAALSALAVGIGVFFRLSVSGSVGLYFVVWWTLLFAILPVRVSTQAEAGEIVAGSDPAAPAHPALRERAIWTSIVSTLVFAAVAAFFPLAGL